MGKLLITLAALLVVHLYVGYYTNLSIHGGEKIFFIKKHPTLQVKFDNLYTKEGDYTPLDRMGAIEANVIIDYCKYRLGIETRLKNEKELEACKAE
jgi:hypothetical protein